MASKHSLETAPSISPTVKRVRTTTSPIVERSYRAHFETLCTLHDWTPSAAVRDKLARLLQLSGNRLQASELLPLAFVQHYPFIWMKDFLLLGYNDANDSVWYEAFPSRRGIARGRYYNSSQVNILGKHTVTKFWQSWVDVFDIEQRGLDRSHEYFTGVYLILQKFPNLRYRCGQREGNPRDPQNATRVTGVVEYPFNDDHPFMQETSGGSDDVDVNADVDIVSDSDTDHEGQSDAVTIKREQTSSHDNEDSSILTSRQSSTHLVPDTSRFEKTLGSSSTPSEHTPDQESSYDEHRDAMSIPHDWSSQPVLRVPSPKPALICPSQATKSTTKKGKISTPTRSPYFARARKQDILKLSRSKSQAYKDITVRVPLDGPRWSNTRFGFADMISVQTVPKTQITDLSEYEGMGFQEI